MTSASTAKRKKRIYWITDEVTGLHRSKGEILDRRGYSVKFLTSMPSLKHELAKQRVGIIIVGDEGPSPEHVEEQLLKITSIPDVQGARLILSTSRTNTKLATLAACSAFRDLIPIDLDSKQWYSRFSYATARRSIPVPEQSPQIALNHIASVAIPARLVWINSERLLFEAKIRPQLGATMHMTGPIAESLGLKQITLSVEECRRTDLLYRFSDAVIARWNVPLKVKDKADLLLRDMRRSNFGPPCKVFLAVQSPKLRSDLVSELDPLRFEVNIALQKQSIVDEPRFFCPNIVFIEDKLCIGDQVTRFQQMLSNLSAEVPVYVVGSHVNIKTLQKLDPVRKIALLPRLPSRLTDAIFTKYLPPTDRKDINADNDSIHIASDHPFSMAEILGSARLLKAHPRSVQLAVPINLGTFGMCRIESPIFKKYMGLAPYGKITDVYNNPRSGAGTFPFVVDCYLCDPNKKHQQQFAVSLTNYASDKILTSVQQQERTQANPVPQLVNGPTEPVVLGIKDDPIIRPVKEAKHEPILDVFAETVEDLASSFKKNALSKNTKNFFIFMAVSAFLVGLLYAFATVIAPYWEKSGSAYTNSLRSFAPKKFESNWPIKKDK